MGRRLGRCHACGEAGVRAARFCGRCGAHLADGHTGASAGGGPRRPLSGADGAHPASTATERTAGTGGRPPWWLAAGGAAAVVGAVAAGLTGGLAETGAEGDDVDLPDEESVENGSDPGPRFEVDAPMTPAGAELDCLVDEPCVRWRTDVDGLLDDRTQAHVASVGGHTLVVRTPHGVAGLDLAGRVRWSRTTSEGATLSTMAPVTVTDEHAVLSTEQGRLHVLEVRTGERRWVAERPSLSEPDGETGRGDDAAGRTPPAADGRDAGQDLRLTDAREYGEVLLLAFQEQWRSEEEPVPAHHLVAYGMDDGAPQWQRRVAHAALVDGAAVAATGDELVGLDPRTGGVRWTRELEGLGDPAAPLDAPGDEPLPMPHQAVPTVALGGRVVAVTVPGGQAVETLLLDPATGRERARLEGRPLPRTVTGHGDDGRLVLGRGEGGHELIAVDADGRTLWERPTGADPEHDVGTSRSHTSIVEDVLVRTETTTDTRLLVIDLADGRVLHEERVQPDRGVHPGALGRSSLLLRDEDTTTAVDLFDGTELWRARGTWAQGGVIAGAVLMQVGHELLAVEHDPRAARRDPRGR